MKIKTFKVFFVVVCVAVVAFLAINSISSQDKKGTSGDRKGSESGDIVTRRDIDLIGTKLTLDKDMDTYLLSPDEDILSIFVGGTEYMNFEGLTPISERVDRIVVKKPLTFDWNHSLENFLWPAGAYGTVWDITNVVGTGTNAIMTGDGTGGGALLTTGAAADDWECTQTADKWYSRLVSTLIDVRLIIATDLVGKEITVGLSDNPMVEDGDYIVLEYDYSVDAVNWWMRSGDGVDATTSVAAAVGAVRLTIYLDKLGNGYFWIDDTYVASVALAVTADTAMYLFVGLKTEATVAEVMTIKRIYTAWN